jgi:hypothetical protein
MGPERVVYFVNGEKQESEQADLKVRQILEKAELTPPENYVLKLDSASQPYSSLDVVVDIRSGNRFTATFQGPTPTS